MIFDDLNVIMLKVILSSLAKFCTALHNNKMVDIYQSTLHESQKTFKIQDTGTCEVEAAQVVLKCCMVIPLKNMQFLWW
jgi:hypothetical protein